MSRIKLIIELLIVLVIMSSLRLGPDLEFVHKAQAVTTNFTLYAAYSGWNFSQPSGPNPTITVTRGDSISFDLIGEDSLPHLLLLDFYGNCQPGDIFLLLSLSFTIRYGWKVDSSAAPWAGLWGLS